MSEQPEFSRVVDRAALAALPAHRKIEANEAEREALARRFGLVALPALSAEATLTPTAAGQVRLDGTLRARVVQSCVVTLEPIAADLDESFTLYYAEAPAAAAHSVDLPIDDEDWPEPIVDGAIDVGEAVAQQLAIALDPYPRAPGAMLDRRYETTDAPAPKPANPFVELARKGGPRRAH
jgi:Large ribosomal RNA subunit accumulation protein YceD